MATSYRFDIATNLALNTFCGVVRDLGRASGVLPSGTRSADLRPGVVTDSNLRVLVGRLGPDEGGTPALGVAPGLAISFLLSEPSEERRQRDDIVRLVADTLGSLPGDAYLSSGDRRIELVRRSGDLILNEDDTFWRVHRQRMLLEPFRRAMELSSTDTAYPRARLAS